MDAAAPPPFSLRRYAHDAPHKYTNSWVADLGETGVLDVYCVALPQGAGIYCIYPGNKEQSFFAPSQVPFWIFCGRQHVGQGRVHDVYPYFEVPADGGRTLLVVVAATLENAKTKLLESE